MMGERGVGHNMNSTHSEFTLADEHHFIEGSTALPRPTIIHMPRPQTYLPAVTQRTARWSQPPSARTPVAPDPIDSSTPRQH